MKHCNQYKCKHGKDVGAYMISYLYLMILMVGIYDLQFFKLPQPIEAQELISPVATSSASLKVSNPLPLTPTPTPSELTEVVSTITEVFEPEGKQVVVRAINCFYSESGLRPNAVGHNKDAVKSTDHGVAQLNSYWHKLTEEEKTDVRANIERAYKIYKGRGGNFSAWYGKLCN